MLRISLFALLLAAAPVSGALAQTAGQGVCVILSVTGSGVVSAPGTGPRAAEAGVGLGRNATLRTEREARVTLRCDGGLSVIVGPSSDFAVLRLLEGEDAAQTTFATRLMRGIAGFLFDGGDDGTGGTGTGVQVRTPSAVAAVRSTEWAMQVSDGASAVFAREGAVFVFGDTGRVRLGPGDGVDVTAAGAVGPVVQWGQPRIDRVSELLGPDW